MSPPPADEPAAPAVPAASDPTPFELDSMARAVRYQRWLFETTRPYLGAHLLEIGAGIGTMTRWLAGHAPTVATDIDDDLLARLRAGAGAWPRPPAAVEHLDIAAGSPADAGWPATIDTVVSYNVLEHIPDDLAAVRGMAAVLRASAAPGPRRLVILVPAHPWAHGTVDVSFGHVRRYSARMLRRLVVAAAPEARIVHLRHLNTAGLPGWVLLGRVLRRPSFGMGSVMLMERLLPVLRPLDRLLHGGPVELPLGQSLVCVAEWPR